MTCHKKSLEFRIVHNVSRMLALCDPLDEMSTGQELRVNKLNVAKFYKNLLCFSARVRAMRDIDRLLAISGK